MEVQLRSPKEIMKLSRLGCFHQSKLSFLRSFLEEFKDWKFSRDLFELNKEGYGRAIYSFSKKIELILWFVLQINLKTRKDLTELSLQSGTLHLHCMMEFQTSKILTDLNKMSLSKRLAD